MNGHILYLALAVGRGHLMRAHTLRKLLATAGVQVDIVTTSEEGKAFLQAMGTPAEVLSNHFYIEYDAQQNLRRRQTELRTLHYVVNPHRGWQDLRWLREKAQAVDLVVNDSLHPALLLAPLRSKWAAIKIVQLYGENIWQATETHFEGYLPRPLNQGYVTSLQALRNRSFGQIVATLEDAAPYHPASERTYYLPTLIPPPRQTPHQVRAALGLGPADKLAVVYLNPSFRAPGLAEQLESALTEQGFHLYGVSEIFGHRPGWRGQDPQLGDVIAAAEVCVSGLGLGTLSQINLFGTPFIGLLTDQPEQQRNATFLQTHNPRFQLVTPDLKAMTASVRQALEALQLKPGEALHRPQPQKQVEARQQRWLTTFLTLLKQAQVGSITMKPSLRPVAYYL